VPLWLGPFTVEEWLTGSYWPRDLRECLANNKA